MKKIIVGMIFLMFLGEMAWADFYGRASEDWRIYTSTGGTVYPPNEKGEIRLEGHGKNTGYRLDLTPLDLDAKVIRWRMNYHENFTVYVRVNTRRGIRYLIYTPRDDDRGLRGQYILIGLGSDASNGIWHTFTRDLQADLERFDVGNQLLSVNRFLIRGSGVIADIETLSRANRVVYEDAEDGSTQRWRIYTDEDGATIRTDTDGIGSRVIDFNGEGKLTGYMLGARSGQGAWNNREADTIEWRMSYGEDFTVYVSVETTNGRRYLVYTPHATNRGKRGSYLRFGLGAFVTDGRWRTFTRNLVRDLHHYEPRNRLVSINAFLIRGSGKVDDISLMTQVPCNIETFHRLMESKVREIDTDYFPHAQYFDDICLGVISLGHNEYSHNQILTLSADGTRLIELDAYGSWDPPSETLKEHNTELHVSYMPVRPSVAIYDVDPVLETHKIAEVED